jgi:hypothetical protein
VPIVGEPLAGDPSAYGSDRLFVRLRSDGGSSVDPTGWHAPVVDIHVPERTAIGAEFVRWEIATAVAGALLGTNPFDEPNVQQAKDATRVLLDRYRADKRLPASPPDETLPGGVELTLSETARRYVPKIDRAAEALLTVIRRGDYFTVLAYIGPDEALSHELQTLRSAVRDRTGAATMFGYGPRYLHSTGQLHKGGPNTGVFLIVTAAPQEDVPIPDEPFSFATLELAQALGDFASLEATGRRALHAHLPAPDPALIRALSEVLLAHVVEND